MGKAETKVNTKLVSGPGPERFSYQPQACGQTMRPREEIGAGKEHILKETGVWAALARSPALFYLPLALHGALQAFCSDADPVSLRIHRKGNRLPATPLRLIAPHFISAHS